MCGWSIRSVWRISYVFAVFAVPLACRGTSNTDPVPAASAPSADASVAAAAASVPAPAEASAAAEAPPDELGPLPADMVLVPAATFTMGDDGEKAASPAHAVRISKAFFIDRTEVTVARYQNCVKRAVCTPALLHGPDVTEAEQQRFGEMCNVRHSDRGDHPVNCVDQSQAATYCAFVDKRLPTEAEWELAARGNDGRQYPWGNAAPRCDFAAAQGCGPVPKARAGTRPVGSFLGGASPFGALDMAGNVYEWVWDGYSTSAYARAQGTDPAERPLGTVGVLRGGAWDFAATRLKAAYRQSFRQATGHVSAGFRCVKGGVPRARPPKPDTTSELPAETQLSPEDLKAALKATGAKLKGNRVINACGGPSDTTIEPLKVGGVVGEALFVWVSGPDRENTDECWRGGYSYVLRRTTGSKRFELILESPGSASIHSESHLGVSNLLLGGSGFCHGVWSWNGKKYEFSKREGPTCAMLEDEPPAAAGAAPSLADGSPEKTEPDEPKPKTAGAAKDEKGGEEKKKKKKKKDKAAKDGK
ncbi:MAG TPA: SUMF1/EgtB/PvdO family nonheme iron enzyme [Polyangiaceae bacterium]